MRVNVRAHMKTGRLALALVLLAACDLRPEDFARSRADTQSFADTWSKKVDALTTRRTTLFTRAQKIPAGTFGIDEVLSRLTAVKAKLDGLGGDIDKARDDASAQLDAHHRRLADQVIVAATTALSSETDDLSTQLDQAEQRLGALEQQVTNPQTPPPPPTRPVPASGAVIEAGFAKGKGIADVMGIEFQAGNAQLDYAKATTQPALDSIVTFAQSCDQLRFDIIGHTAKDGNANVNQRLSLAQAGSVRNYLLQHGVTATKIDRVLGVGGTQPSVAEPDPGTPEEKAMATDALAAVREQNRRVSIAVITPCS